MNQGCSALFEHELAAFALPAGLDRPPPRAHFSAADEDRRRLDDSLDAMEALGLSAPVFSAADFEAAMLFAEPDACAPPTTPSGSSSSSGSGRASQSRSRAKPYDGGSAASPRSPPAHRHHSKKASRKQVHELQAMVNAMQVQVDGAAAEIQQLAQLVGQFAQQRQDEHAEHERFRRREAEQQQEQRLFKQREMDMDLDAQQRHLSAQVRLEREQYMREQQRGFEGCSPTLSLKHEPFSL
jgi:hypothetical protein